jgi:hypothetical protein
VIRMLVALVLLGLCKPLAAQTTSGTAGAPDVLVRQTARQDTGAVIGQRMALYVDVLFRDAMPRPPRVSVPDVPGLQMFRFETQGLTENETIADQSYVGQRFEFALYARRGGGFDVPPAVVTLLDRQGAEAAKTHGQPVHLEVTVPPGVDPSQPVVATHHFTLGEQWDPNPKREFHAGDAIVRTITRTADDVPGLAMRDLIFSTPEGARAYVDPPDLNDDSDRGVVTGRRVDRVTYVFERGGRFVLPALTQPWWDLAAGAIKTADAVGVTIDVSALPAASSGTKTTSRTLWLVAAGAAVIIALALGHILHRGRSRKESVEHKAFASLRRACASADAASIYRAFADWRRCLAPTQQAAAIAAAGPLEASLFARNRSAWNINNSTEFITRLIDIRRRLHSTNIRNIPLPPLNPEI